MTSQKYLRTGAPGGLGRHVEHDPRSRAYAAGTEPPGTPVLRTVAWQRHGEILDQGHSGTCVGYALAAWLTCEPHCTTQEDASRYGQAFAESLCVDGSGGSVVAVCRAAKAAGVLAEYRWAFSVLGLLRALQHGPVIVGIPWVAGFDEPGPTGIITPRGDAVGGHQVLVRGAEKQLLAPGGWWLHCDNSWGTDWGLAGSFRVSLAVFGQLVARRGDVTVPLVAPG